MAGAEGDFIAKNRGASLPLYDLESPVSFQDSFNIFQLGSYRSWVILRVESTQDV